MTRLLGLVLALVVACLSPVSITESALAAPLPEGVHADALASTRAVAPSPTLVRFAYDVDGLTYDGAASLALRTDVDAGAGPSRRDRSMRLGPLQRLRANYLPHKR